MANEERVGREGCAHTITYTASAKKKPSENWDHTEAAPESGWPQVHGRWKTDAHPPRHGPTENVRASAHHRDPADHILAWDTWSP